MLPIASSISWDVLYWVKSNCSSLRDENRMTPILVSVGEITKALVRDFTNSLHFWKFPFPYISTLPEPSIRNPRSTWVLQAKTNKRYLVNRQHCEWRIHAIFKKIFPWHKRQLSQNGSSKAIDCMHFISQLPSELVKSRGQYTTLFFQVCLFFVVSALILVSLYLQRLSNRGF